MTKILAKSIAIFEKIYYSNNSTNLKKSIERGAKYDKSQNSCESRERERERATTLINNNQAKKLALLSILKTGYEYENT